MPPTGIETAQISAHAHLGRWRTWPWAMSHQHQATQASASTTSGASAATGTSSIPPHPRAPERCQATSAETTVASIACGHGSGFGANVLLSAGPTLLVASAAVGDRRDAGKRVGMPLKRRTTRHDEESTLGLRAIGAPGEREAGRDRRDGRHPLRGSGRGEPGGGQAGHGPRGGRPPGRLVRRRARRPVPAGPAPPTRPLRTPRHPLPGGGAVRDATADAGGGPVPTGPHQRAEDRAALVPARLRGRRADRPERALPADERPARGGPGGAAGRDGGPGRGPPPRLRLRAGALPPAPDARHAARRVPAGAARAVA